MLPVTIPEATADWLLEVAAAPAEAAPQAARVAH